MAWYNYSVRGSSLVRTIILSIIFFVLAIFAVWFYIKKNYGDVRPAVLPPSKNIVEIIENQKINEQVGLPVEFPLKLPSEYNIGIFAKQLGNARDLEFSPNGTLLVTIPAEGKIVALPDHDNNGEADLQYEVVSGLRRPHGIAFHPFESSQGKNGKLFIAEETQVSRYNWDEETYRATLDKVLFSLPAGGQHTTRTLAIKPDGTLFVTLGSTCDACFERHPFLAAVIVSDINGKNPQLFARGLRNSVFITLNPKTNELWGTEMGRDHLGDNLPPDEINIIRDGREYGWPVCFGDKIYDRKFGSKSPEYCENTESPIYEIPAHSAPLGLTFIDSPQFPESWQGDLLVAYHGSWNRSTPIGYKVVRLNVEGNRILGEEDFLSGFLQGSEALGRPVDVIFDEKGSLYISDDKAGAIYKVVKK